MRKQMKWFVKLFFVIYYIKTWNNTKYIALPAQHLLDNLQMIGIKPLNTTYN